MERCPEKGYTKKENGKGKERKEKEAYQVVRCFKIGTELNEKFRRKQNAWKEISFQLKKLTCNTMIGTYAEINFLSER